MSLMNKTINRNYRLLENAKIYTNMSSNVICHDETCHSQKAKFRFFRNIIQKTPLN